MVCRAFRNKHPTNSGMYMHAQHSLSIYSNHYTSGKRSLHVWN